MAQTTLSERKITDLVRREVIDVMREVLSDPDAGLELTPGAVRRLKHSIKAKEAGKTKPLADIFKKYRV